MDSKTLDQYSANALDVSQRLEAAQFSLCSRFATTFAPDGRVQGCGFVAGLINQTNSTTARSCVGLL